MRTYGDKIYSLKYIVKNISFSKFRNIFHLRGPKVGPAEVISAMFKGDAVDTPTGGYTDRWIYRHYCFRFKDNLPPRIIYQRIIYHRG